VSLKALFTSRDFSKMIRLYDLHAKYLSTWSSLSSLLSGVKGSSDFILGDNVLQLEKKICCYSESRFAVTTANGTDALIISLKYLRTKYPTKTEVITTPLSYLASTSSIILAGLTPVFCDIDDSLNLDPEKLEEHISEKTLCILFVHYAGNPTNLERIQNFASKNLIPVIEDCAQAYGAKVASRHVGTQSFSGCVSLHPLKMLSCMGDGGFILTQDPAFAEYAFTARNHGHTSRDDIIMWSLNSRLDTIQAAITINQFGWFENELLTRRSQYGLFRSLLPSSYFPRVENNVQPSLNWLVLLVKNRQLLVEHLTSSGIEVKIHYPKLIPELSAAQQLSHSLFSLEVATCLKQQILSVPIGSHINNASIRMICKTLLAFHE
jgi:UDP-2-acetamido-2-deoxy-ribo-hexuluronate aminotransferase